MLVEKFIGVVEAITTVSLEEGMIDELEIPAQDLRGIEEICSERLDTYEEALQFIQEQETQLTDFLQGEVKKIFVRP